MAPPSTPDRCPRCGGSFACGMAGPDPCACTTVQLGAPRLAQLRQRFDGCLCLNCLTALAGGAPLEPPVRSAEPERSEP